jgi:S1-C subfamily serine protease
MVSLNREDTPDLEAFQKMIRRYRAGDTVELGLVRGSQDITIEVTQGEMPPLRRCPRRRLACRALFTHSSADSC